MVGGKREANKRERERGRGLKGIDGKPGESNKDGRIQHLKIRHFSLRIIFELSPQEGHSDFSFFNSKVGGIIST